MMRRATALALAAALVGGILAIPAGPAGAQNGDSLLDAPRLGFEIDPDSGHVGDIVGAQVDPADVQEHCVTTEEQLIPQFYDMPDGSPDRNAPWNYPGPVLADWMQYGPLLGIEPLDPWPNLPFPPVPDDPPAGVDPLAWAWFRAAQYGQSTSRGYQEVFRVNHEQLAAETLFYFFDSLGADYTLLSEPMRAAYIPATFILTFVDPVTQELVGNTSTFDPETGAGNIVTPDLDAGLWAIAAACVEPSVDEESFMAAVAAGAQWLEDHAVPTTANILVDEDLGLEAGYLLESLASVMLPELMVPRALGIDFYCILQDDGFCATPPDPVGLLEELSDEELAEFAELEAGADDAGTGSDVDAGLLTEAVTAAPSFTG